VRVVLCNCSPDQAQELARALVQEKLAACVNILPTVRSIYTWEGQVQDDAESTLIIKTAQATLARLVDRLQALHSYDVPEILVLPVDVDASSRAYVTWVRSVCGP